MSEALRPTANPVPWPLRQVGRFLTSIVAGGAAALTTTTLPFETRVVLGLDVFLLSFVALTCRLMSVSTGDMCAHMAKQLTVRHAGLIASIVTSLVGIATIAVMLRSQKDHASWLRAFHLSASLLALLLGWVAAQMIFGVQYMRLYYNDLQSQGSGARADPDLAFPGQSAPDLWDFMYYSFTIAMCFQTSDVSINSKSMRRLTLLHAIYSFFFVAAIIGFVVNVLSSLA